MQHRDPGWSRRRGERKRGGVIEVGPGEFSGLDCERDGRHAANCRGWFIRGSSNDCGLERSDGIEPIRGGLPVPEIHYVAAPVAAFGFDEKSVDGFPQRADRFDLSRVFQYWLQNPSRNMGLIYVPRGLLNSSYPNPAYTAPAGVFDDELTLQSREQVPGLLHGDDQWVTASGGDPARCPGFLSRSENTAILEGAPHNPGQGDQASTSLFDGIGQRHYALYKLGLGELMPDGLDRGGGDFVFIRADFIVEAPAQSDSIRDVEFTVHRMLSNWDEATATWAQFGSGSGPDPGVDFETISLGLGFLGQGATSATVDVKNAATLWLSDPATNFRPDSHPEPVGFNGRCNADSQFGG